MAPNCKRSFLDAVRTVSQLSSVTYLHKSMSLHVCIVLSCSVLEHYWSSLYFFSSHIYLLQFLRWICCTVPFLGKVCRRFLDKHGRTHLGQTPACSAHRSHKVFCNKHLYRVIFTVSRSYSPKLNLGG